MILVLPTILLLLFGGAALTLIGLRGRRVDDHPYCRKCGFDLIGLPEGVSRCSECGADLAHPRAIRIGQRRRRPAMIASGVTMLLISAGTVLLVAVLVVRQVGVDRLKPTWFLVLETRDTRNASAWKELTRRAAGGSLPASTASTLTERVLTRQADLNIIWQPNCGDFLETARDAKQVTDVQWQRYARQAPQFSLELRKQVRAGDDLPAYIRNTANRVGNRSRFSVRLTNETHSGELTRAEPRYDGSSQTTLGLSPTGSAAAGHTVLLDHDACRTAAAGERNVRVSFDAAMLEGPQRDTVIAEWKHDLDGSWTLVPADARAVEMIEDETLRPLIAKAIRIPRVSLQRRNGRQELTVDIRCDNTPVPLAFDAVARDPATGREWQLSTVTFNAGGSIHSGLWGDIKEFDAQTIDLVLQPSERAARDTTTITRMWNGELVMKGLAVTKNAR